MTPRRFIVASSIAGALSLGALAVPATAGAAPAGHAVSYVTTGRDPLAGFAGAALDAWTRYVATRNSHDLADFATVRDALAVEAAHRLGLDPAQMQAAWRRADQPHQVALVAAMTQLGTPYRRNTSKPGVGFDCSGLTTWAWAQTGASLVRQSRGQINAIRNVGREAAQAGDIVYYPGHVMLYLGVDNAIIHAPNTGSRVQFGFVAGSHVKRLRFGNPVG